MLINRIKHGFSCGYISYANQVFTSYRLTKREEEHDDDFDFYEQFIDPDELSELSESDQLFCHPILGHMGTYLKELESNASISSANTGMTVFFKYDFKILN